MQVLFVTIGARRFALDCAEIREVLPVVNYRSALTGPPWLLGLFNLRGALVPLVDLPMLVNGGSESLRMGSRIVVLRLEADLFSATRFHSDSSSFDASVGKLVGLLVPEIAGLGECDFTDVGAHAGFAFAGAPHLGPTTVDAQGMVQLLRCRRILEGDAALRELPASTDS